MRGYLSTKFQTYRIINVRDIIETVTEISREEIGKLGLSIEEEFLSEPSIGFLSSSKSKFRDLDQ